MRIAALTTDLMDRSRLSAAAEDVEFTTDPSACAGADVVVVDLARYADRGAGGPSRRAARPHRGLRPARRHRAARGRGARRRRRRAPPIALLPGSGRRARALSLRDCAPWPTTRWTPPSPTTSSPPPGRCASVSTSNDRWSRRLILECLRLAVQSPTGSNSQNWHWLVVTDAEKRAQLKELYGAMARPYLESQADEAARPADPARCTNRRSTSWTSSTRCRCT